MCNEFVFYASYKQGGEKVADFESVYHLYYCDVYRYALSLCRNEATAEEITQETFCKAFSSLEHFDGKCKVSVWLCQIAKNIYFTMCRKKKFVATDTDITLLADEHSMEEQYYTKQTAIAIREALNTLEEPYKDVFSARVFGEMSFKQIAKLFGRTENWARVTYHRAKVRIKEALK